MKKKGETIIEEGHSQRKRTYENLKNKTILKQQTYLAYGLMFQLCKLARTLPQHWKENL